jgi:hypothetical protein
MLTSKGASGGDEGEGELARLAVGGVGPRDGVELGAGHGELVVDADDEGGVVVGERDLADPVGGWGGRR